MTVLPAFYLSVRSTLHFAPSPQDRKDRTGGTHITFLRWLGDILRGFVLGGGWTDILHAGQASRHPLTTLSRHSVMRQKDTCLFLWHACWTGWASVAGCIQPPFACLHIQAWLQILLKLSVCIAALSPSWQACHSEIQAGRQVAALSSTSALYCPNMSPPLSLSSASLLSHCTCISYADASLVPLQGDLLPHWLLGSCSPNFSPDTFHFSAGMHVRLCPLTFPDRTNHLFVGHASQVLPSLSLQSHCVFMGGSFLFSVPCQT